VLCAVPLSGSRPLFPMRSVTEYNFNSCSTPSSRINYFFHSTKAKCASMVAMPVSKVYRRSTISRSTSLNELSSTGNLLRIISHRSRANTFPILA